MIQSMAFTAYAVGDMARLRDFYEHGLGLSLSYDYKREGVEHDIGGGTFAITTMETGQRPGARGGEVGFEVTDLDSVVS